MYQTKTIKQKIGLFMTILLPILVTQLSLYAMNFFDTMMSGHAGANDLAGVAIGSSIWVPAFTGLSGILLSITPIVSQLIGSEQKQHVSFSVMQGIYLSIGIAILIFIIGIFSLDSVLNTMNLETEVQTIAKNYLTGLSFGILPIFIYTVFRCFIDALGKTRVTMTITLLSLPINVLFNYLLIFGKFGFPKLGGVGAGYASAITYWCIFLIALYVIHRKEPFSHYRIFQTFFPITLSVWKEQLKIGIPIGFAIFFETSIFAAVTLLMSNFNTITIAAHQAALNFASFLYMVPLSISMALTVAVGYEVGARRYKDAVHYSYLGIGTGIMMALFCAVGLLAFNEQIANLYTSDKTVLNLIKQFLLYAIFFQLSDAVAAPIQGALRGYKDVNVTLFMALISYWVIGLPVGYYLANYTTFEAFGYWIGLSSGLTTAAVTLFMRLYQIQHQRNIKILNNPS